MDANLVAALISAGATAAGQGINAGVTGKMNKKSMAFSRQMYDQQTKDNLAQWERVNEYNSPAAMMQRYKDAGLNPAMMYGNGGGGGTAQSIPTPDVQTPQYRTPEWGNAISAAGTSFQAYYDMTIKQAQLDNLEAQNAVIREEASLKAAQTKATTAQTNRSMFDLDFESELRGTSADIRRETLRQTRNNIDISLRQDARNATANAASVQEAFERMETLRLQRQSELINQAKSSAEIKRIRAETIRIRQDVQNMKKDGTLKQLDIELRKNGISPNDPWWSRIVGRAAASFFDLSKDSGSIWDWIQDKPEISRLGKKD